MPSFSLIVFISSREQEAGLDLAPYRDVLEARFEPESVEIILAGRVDAGATEGRENGVMAIEAQGGEVEAVRAAIKAATGDIVIVPAGAKHNVSTGGMCSWLSNAKLFA